MAAYRDFFQNVPIPWMNGSDEGQRYWGAIGDAFDTYVARLKAAVQARMPQRAPEDALGIIGSERGLDQGPAESEVAYRLRLRQAWDQWRFAGTAYELILQLHHQNFRDAAVVQQNGLYHYFYGGTPDGIFTVGDLATHPQLQAPWWTTDFDEDFTSRFWVIFDHAPVGSDVGNLDDQEFQARAHAVVERWRPAKATFLGFIRFGTENGSQDPTLARTFGWPRATFGEMASSSFGLLKGQSDQL